MHTIRLDTVEEQSEPGSHQLAVRYVSVDERAQTMAAFLVIKVSCLNSPHHLPFKVRLDQISLLPNDPVRTRPSDPFRPVLPASHQKPKPR